MKSWNKTIEFNEENSLYKILHAYFVQNDIELSGKKHNEISRKLIRNLIYNRGAIVNSVKTVNDTYKIKNGDRIQITSIGVDFICIENKNLITRRKLATWETEIKSEDKAPNSNAIIQKVTKVKPVPVRRDAQSESIDRFILFHIKSTLDCASVEEVKSLDSKNAFCRIIELFQIKGFEEIKKSKYSYELTDFIKEVFVSSKLSKELEFPKNHLAFIGEIIDSIIKAKNDKEKELIIIIQELKSGLYDRNTHRFLQTYGKIVSSAAFQYLIAPYSETTVYSRVAIENLIKPITDAYLKTDNEAKYLYFDSSKEIYLEYLTALEKGSSNANSYFLDIANYLYNLFKEVCDAKVEKSASLFAQSTLKKYNFQNSERQTQDIFLNIGNAGEGLAKDVKIKSVSDSFQFADYYVGLLKSSETREVTIQSKIIIEENISAELKLLILWEEPSGKKEQECVVKFELQDVNVPWDVLSKQSPYSIQIIEEKSKLYGRDEILEELQTNILSHNIESYKIWGQKRVGKSSIVKTLKSIFNDSENVLIIYRSILGLRNPDPLKTLNDLGESICSEILIEIENKIKSPTLRDQLKNISIPTFSGSFYPLEKFISKLHIISNDLKFIFIIDEFDRINEEFFRASDLGEGFSGSIGKALNEYKYIGFILVGSENMQLLEKQGMNYNSYLEREVDTFKKATQYSSFKNIVLGPVLPYISFSEDSIERIFEVTNGNPYFTNLICKEAFKIAHKNRDSFIDIHFINDAIDLIVKSSQKSHFEHFWGDGLAEESDARKDRTTDIRRRILVSYSINAKAESNHFSSKSDILKRFKYPEEYVIEKYEVENTINEFFVRKIFSEKNNSIRIQPLLFESWLCGPGKTLIIEGVSDLEALHREIELEQEFSLKDEELSRLCETLEYQERNISVNAFRDYFKQFGNSIEQRKIFKLLDSIYYISKEEIADFFRKEQKNIFSKHEIELKSNVRTPFREGIELYSFDSTIQENQLINESFKVLNSIRSTKTVKNIKTESDVWRRNGSDELIIVEPVIDEAKNLIQELLNFITDEIKQKNIPVRLVTLLITTKAKTNLVKATSTIPNFKLIIYKEVEETKIKPFIQGTELFENSDESNLAFAEVRKKIPSVNRDSTLLVLFGSHCPSKSCPILWYRSPQFNPIFLNEFGKLEETKSTISEEENRRTRVYHANRELSQSLNQFIVNHIKNKAKKSGKDDWFDAEYIPKSVMESVSVKWIAEGTKNLKESYFDFSDYKKIIQLDKDLTAIFTLKDEGLAWCDKLNVLRRDPAHPEKTPPTEKEAEYFERIKNLILLKLN